MAFKKDFLWEELQQPTSMKVAGMQMEKVSAVLTAVHVDPEQNQEK